MKINQTSLLLSIIFLLTGCNSFVAPSTSPTPPKPTLTPTLVPTHTPLPTLTPTTVPVMTAVPCQPASNPWSFLDTNEYHGGWYPNITISKVCIFSGKVVRGQIYKHQINQNLVFCLIPSSIFEDTPNAGWNVLISELSSNSCDISSDDFMDFSGLVSPPWHGNFSLFIYGWEFRNKDNTGERTYGNNTNLPESQFNFVLNREDYIEQENQFNPFFKCPTVCRDIPRSRGTLTITDMKLGNLIPNSKAWIEYMEFEVKIYLPAE